MNDEYYMEIAYQEALKALEKDEVPVGAIIVKDDHIIARGYNCRENSQNVICHAEIIAIQEACKVLHTWRLEDCVLYTTLEPCLMCSGAIIQSRIKKVVFGANDNKWLALTKIINHKNLNHFPMIQNEVLKDKCSNLISSYFKQKR